MVPSSKWQGHSPFKAEMLGSTPVGIISLLGLKARTSASQAGNVGFKSRRRYCGYSTTASTAGCGPAYEGSIPSGHPKGK